MKIKTPKGKEYDVDIADSVLKKFIGMRFRKKGKMLFKFRRPVRARIDMLFVPTDLYLYFLDKEKRVIQTQKAESYTLNPSNWSFYRPEISYSYLLESSENLDLSQGDRLEF